MANFWTEEQQKVIDLRDRNILVSAAAGSGKTAVLVERILQRIMDEKNPVDIDRLLIVTFTRAAAAEMRERIGLAIQKKILEQPENEHLQRQEALLFHAQITTIDSFCQSVIRNYFHMIDLDPGFSIIDEGEAKLLRRDTADELLEEKYAEGEETFYQFVECFASGKKDDGLTEWIMRLYDFAQSYPWPLQWLEECRRAYEIDCLQELEQSEWMQELLNQTGLILQDLRQITEEALAVAASDGGPYMYEEALREDEALLSFWQKQKSYGELSRAFQEFEKFAVLSRKRDGKVSEEKREKVKEMRDRVKKGIQSVREQFFYQEPEEMLADIQRSRGPAQVLFSLAGEFGERFAEKKRERNLVDFSDLEHMALQILVRQEDGNAVPTEAARSLAGRFEEIMIDEYQDSNLVQELLLTSVSRCTKGQNNIFMVGDVKQSIYRFRLARPELFMEKYETYTEDESPKQKIELHKNFRSRSEVLEHVNFLFRKLMHRELGNVEYDDRAALYAGAQFPRLETNVENAFARAENSPLAGAELLLLDLDGETFGQMGETEENDRELEARMIGTRIKELVGKELVYDREEGVYRRVRWSDVVILLRSVTGWAESFLSVLSDMGIPAYTGTKSGYFSASEVQTVLALLKIMDNPRQEIPFTAVLASPIGSFSTEELARIRTEFPEMPFFEACGCYREEGKESKIREKLADFFALLQRFRSYVPYTPMHELLWKILEETGYMDYVSAMPAGGQRRANLEMLSEKAAAYESTSYRGLFNFIRYIENLQKYEVDFGEAGISGEAEDTVRIMSIHKSKGLEFPVVFVAGLGKKFNQQDSRSAIAVHPKFGVGCDCVDPVLRIKVPTLLKKVIQRQLAWENLGEELRVLYVALTRAKEKLYLTGGLKKLDEKRQKWGGRGKQERLPFLELSGASSALEWVLRAELFGQESWEAAMPVTVFTPQDLTLTGKKEAWEGVYRKEELLFGSFRDGEEQRRLEEWLNRATREAYPWENGLDMIGKLSVSELKRQSQREEWEEAKILYEEPVMVPLVPDFIEKKEENTALRGTATHHVMELLDFSCADTMQKVQKQIEALILEGRLTREESRLVNLPSIVHFFRTELGGRMAAAWKRGELYREKQFVAGVKASRIRKDWPEEELVLVQGIIDAWFEEDGELILVDYKTDHVGALQENVLVQRYQVQLEYYGEALEQMTGKRVREKLIYSFCLQKEIAI